MRLLRKGTALFPCAASLALCASVFGWGLSPAGSSTADPWQAAPTAIVGTITHLPETVFNAVSLQPTVLAPVILKGQSPLTFNGKPGIYYEGAEPCPYCAAERWAFIIAMSRFGSWSGLGVNQSSANDIDPSTQTFTFVRATYSSPYVTIRTKEILSNQKLSNGDYAPLERPTRGSDARRPLHHRQILSGQSWVSAVLGLRQSSRHLPVQFRPLRTSRTQPGTDRDRSE